MAFCPWCGREQPAGAWRSWAALLLGAIFMAALAYVVAERAHLAAWVRR